MPDLTTLRRPVRTDWSHASETSMSPFGGGAMLSMRSAVSRDIRRVVTNLGVFDFETPDRTMRLCSLHPGVSLDDVRSATGFDLVIPDGIPETRGPTDDELHVIRDVIDREGLRLREVRAP